MESGIVIPADFSDVEKAIFLVKFSDRAISYTREILYKIFSEKSWEAKYGSWGEFVEDGLNKSQGWASKNLAIYRFFTLEGGIPQDEMQFDTEKLYMSLKVDGSVQEKLAKARTLTRRELKEEKNDDTPCEHDIVQICGKCHIRL